MTRTSMPLSYNNQTTTSATILYKYCTGGTKMPQSYTWQPLSMHSQNYIRGRLEILSIRREPMPTSTILLCLLENKTFIPGVGAPWY